MKKVVMTLLALTFPWVVMLIKDNPGAAVMALVMQASVIGWLPASLWALRVAKEGENANTTSEKP